MGRGAGVETKGPGRPLPTAPRAAQCWVLAHPQGHLGLSAGLQRVQGPGPASLRGWGLLASSGHCSQCRHVKRRTRGVRWTSPRSGSTERGGWWGLQGQLLEAKDRSKQGQARVDWGPGLYPAALDASRRCPRGRNTCTQRLLALPTLPAPHGLACTTLPAPSPASSFCTPSALVGGRPGPGASAGQDGGRGCAG